uniref:Exportin-5 C-terminal domain-containing protein n=1 Tax=Talaromyces marneffei PM1 TaxID=1077442 RepID=A0A093XXU9_TALMA
MSYAASFLEDKDLDLQSASRTDIPFLFEFLIEILRHQSLTVSIPVLHSWSRLLTAERVEQMDFVARLIAPLLEICTQRLVRWENLPEDSEDPTILFLNDDIDTIPERHAFVGNYRRYCSTVIEVIVQKRPYEAVPHILSDVNQNLSNLYNGVQPFSVATFQKASFPLMRADTQFSVVEATLKGYQKWIIAHGRSPQEDEQQRTQLEQAIENWAMSLMQRNFEDPILKQRVIRLVVDISSKALDKTPSFALKVLEHILMTHLEDQPQYPAYSDAVRELHSLASHELRRLSMRYADYFFTFYDVLEPKIREIAAAHQLDDKLQTELISVLLIITQRTKNVDPRVREERLNSFMEPVRTAWQNEEFRNMSSSFNGFCELLGLEKVGPYMQSKQAATIEDWSAVPLDSIGKDIQGELARRFQQLPLRGTKTLLAVSTEKLKRTDPAYELGCALWRNVIPTILPTLLQLIGHAHAFHNPSNWSSLSQDMMAVVGQILTDRFWQAGISTGSRDDFYTKITTSKATLEGFASSVRGKVRAVRESCYSMLFSMSRLRQYFYGFEELPGPLSEALFKDSTHLSSHQFSILLNISRCLIDDCPVQYREHFLPPMISTLFKQVDKKVTEEWDNIEQRKTGLVDGDLTEEMKDESILRQLTYSAVIMVASLLDPQRGDAATSDDPSAPQPPMREHHYSSPSFYSCRLCTSGQYSHSNTIREFISTEVLRACITSVHEPYFVDMQRDLATLIASIWVLYGSSTTTPRSVMLSLPGMHEQRVAQTETALMSSTSGRQQRALVLDLLEGLRGVSISEQGKILGTREERRKARSAMQQRYMSTAPPDMEGQQKTKVNIDDGPDLGGLADMFG